MKKRLINIFSGIIIAGLLLAPGSWFPFRETPLWAMTFDEEQKLGEQVLKEVEGQYTLIRDPLLLGYLNKIGQDILQQFGHPPYSFRFFLLKDPQLNAFSVPGGYIFVSTGIVEVMDSEGELAGLLGHEITHIMHHHISKQTDQQKKIGMATIAAAILGIFAGDPRITSAVLTGSMATAQTLALKYSREDEDDADNFGFKAMSKAGYNPKYMVDLLDKLRRWGSFGPEGVPAYMQTHPLTGDRMLHIDNLIHQYAAQGPWPRRSSDDFRRFQTLILTKYGNLQRARNRFESWAKESHSLLWVYYGQGWISIRQGNFDQAVSQFQQALKLKPHEPFILRDLGEAYFLKGDLDQALQQLGQASLLDLQDGTTAFYLARTYQEKGEYSLALENFKRAMRLGTEGEDLYHYLGMVYGKLNDLGKAHYYFGLSFKRKGDLPKALFHFQTALKYAANDPVDRDLIEKEIKSTTPQKPGGKKPGNPKEGGPQGAP
jgi:beta-barrel assembly-enhancing protease